MPAKTPRRETVTATVTSAENYDKRGFGTAEAKLPDGSEVVVRFNKYCCRQVDVSANEPSLGREPAVARINVGTRLLMRIVEGRNNRWNSIIWCVLTE